MENNIHVLLNITKRKLKVSNMELNIYQTYKVTITHTGATKTYEGFEDFKYTDSVEMV